jgi:C4-dicarboxylate-specific signal transduction histidine kinase
MSMLLQRERNNKLANIDVVVGAIAHEVRQPLAAIATQAAAAGRWLNRTPPDLGEAKTSLQEIDRASMRASDVFGTIRGLFVNSNAEKGLFDINSFILQALGLLSEELKAHSIDMRLQQASDLPPILGHESQLQEVILNLVQNAIDAMSSVSDRLRILLVKTDRLGAAIVISVEDTGPGIDPEKMSTIFDKFVSTKVKGMGLGLAICKSIVEGHHGQLVVLSGTDGGARFQITIPIEPNSKRARNEPVSLQPTSVPLLPMEIH